jgi:hypothetical protein
MTAQHAVELSPGSDEHSTFLMKLADAKQQPDEGNGPVKDGELRPLRVHRTRKCGIRVTEQ